MIHTRLSVLTKYRDPCAIIVSGIIKRKIKVIFLYSFYFFFIVNRKLNRKIDIYYIDDWEYSQSSILIIIIILLKGESYYE